MRVTKVLSWLFFLFPSPASGGVADGQKSLPEVKSALKLDNLQPDHQPLNVFFKLFFLELGWFKEKVHPQA